MLILIVFFNDTATTESYTYWHTLSLHVALPISEGFTLATEVADWLSRRGVPFAQAHEITGAVVRLCEERGIELEQLSAADLALVDPRLDISIKAALTPEARSEEHTSELQSLMRISYAVFCLQKTTTNKTD